MVGAADPDLPLRHGVHHHVHRAAAPGRRRQLAHHEREPIFALVLAWAILGQSIAASQVGGGLLVVATALWLGRRKLQVTQPSRAPKPSP
jgi:uncharacterized membrane protein